MESTQTTLTTQPREEVPLTFQMNSHNDSFSFKVLKQQTCFYCMDSTCNYSLHIIFARGYLLFYFTKSPTDQNREVSSLCTGTSHKFHGVLRPWALGNIPVIVHNIYMWTFLNICFVSCMYHLLWQRS